MQMSNQNMLLKDTPFCHIGYFEQKAIENQ
jgi:hypothetical protein